jgi:hypothetical protein
VASTGTSVKDEKRKRLKLEQMEDSMGNGVNVMNGRSEVGTATTRLEQRRDNDVEKRQAIREGNKEASKQQASKQLE